MGERWSCSHGASALWRYASSHGSGTDSVDSAEVRVRSRSRRPLKSLAIHIHTDAASSGEAVKQGAREQNNQDQQRHIGTVYTEKGGVKQQQRQRQTETQTKHRQNTHTETQTKHTHTLFGQTIITIAKQVLLYMA